MNWIGCDGSLTLSADSTDERLVALEARLNQIGGGPLTGTTGTTTGTRTGDDGYDRYDSTTGTAQVPPPQVPAIPQQPPPPPPPTPPATPQTPPDTPQTPTATPQTSKVFNPDISVIGNFIGVAGKNEFSSQPRYAVERSGGVVSGRHRSVLTRRFLYRRRVRRGRSSKRATSRSRRCPPACC